MALAHTQCPISRPRSSAYLDLGSADLDQIWLDEIRAKARPKSAAGVLADVTRPPPPVAASVQLSACAAVQQRQRLRQPDVDGVTALAASVGAATGAAVGADIELALTPVVSLAKSASGGVVRRVLV